MTKPRRTVAQLVPAIRRAGLMGTMALSVAFVATLALWDETRESSAALEDFAQDQVTLAKIAAAELSAQLSVVRRDALIASVNHSVGRETPTGLFADYVSVHVRQNSEAAADPPHDERAFLLTVPMADATRSVDVVVPIRFLVAGVSQLERANTVLSLIVPPSTQRFHTARDHLADEGFIAEALDEGREVVFLDREEAARLELPVGPAVAAFARVDAGSLGQWGVAVVASAGRERDREIRARWRLVLGVLLAGGLVLVFGGFALRARRHELELERTLAIAELQQARDAQLGRENRAATMVTLAAGVAHEVSSPLSVIVGRAENLLERGGDEKSTRGLQSILEQADRIRQVIRDFLRLARGDVPMLDRVEPRAVAEGAIRLVEHRFSNAEVLISAEIADDLPMIRGDQHLLEQALVNLLLNACDACQPGGHVAIAVSADASDVTFKITDDGSGITPANAARVLEPFFSTKPVEQGTGLGLAIASEILKIHRGSLTLTARDPRGTEACVRVPNSPRGADAAA